MIIDIMRELDDHKKFERNFTEKRGKLKSVNVLEKKMTQMNYGIVTWNDPNSMILTTNQQFDVIKYLQNCIDNNW